MLALPADVLAGSHISGTASSASLWRSSFFDGGASNSPGMQAKSRKQQGGDTRGGGAAANLKTFKTVHDERWCRMKSPESSKADN